MPSEHGTYSRYNSKCRCEPCKLAARTYAQERKRRFAAGELELPHPSWSAYAAGCKCDPCRAMNAQRQRENRLKRDYGLTPPVLDDMREAQGNACAVCRTSFEERAMNIDHNHETGAVRELLCQPCNAALGQLGENAQVIRALADYIEKHNNLVTV